MTTEPLPRSGGDLPRQRGRLVRRTLTGAALASCSWIAGAAAPFSLTALVSVLVPGVVLGAIACRWPPERIPAPARLDITGVSYWAICLIALFEWEAASYQSGSRPWHPTLSLVVGPVLQPHAVRSAAFLGWLLLGWGLVRR